MIMHLVRLAISLSPLKLAAVAALAACAGASSSSPVDNHPVGSASNAEAPCPPARPRAIREGTAVINASPDDLPGAVGERTKLRGDQVHGVPPAAAEFQLWRDGGRWHLRATGAAGTQLQARVQVVRDVTAEAAFDGLRVIHTAWLTPGRCPDDPPVADPVQVRGGFDLTADGAAHGITFTPSTSCFVVDVRRAGAPVSVAIGDRGSAVGGVEICP